MKIQRKEEIRQQKLEKVIKDDIRSFIEELELKTGKPLEEIETSVFAESIMKQGTLLGKEQEEFSKKVGLISYDRIKNEFIRFKKNNWR
jgi:hypothetical protein